MFDGEEPLTRQWLDLLSRFAVGAEPGNASQLWCGALLKGNIPALGLDKTRLMKQPGLPYGRLLFDDAPRQQMRLLRLAGRVWLAAAAQRQSKPADVGVKNSAWRPLRNSLVLVGINNHHPFI